MMLFPDPADASNLPSPGQRGDGRGVSLERRDLLAGADVPDLDDRRQRAGVLQFRARNGELAPLPPPLSLRERGEGGSPPLSLRERGEGDIRHAAVLAFIELGDFFAGG